MKQESFLSAVYEIEGISVNQIAELTFSSRPTIVKYLRALNIALREEDRLSGTLPYGKRWRKGQVALDRREQIAIERVKQLRSQGLSFDKIASIMNTMGVRTKTGRAKW